MTGGNKAEISGESAVHPNTVIAAANTPFPPARAAWYTIGMLALINMLDNIDRGIISLLIQPIKRDMGLSDTEIGILTGIAFSGFYALVGLPMSRLADTRNRKYILTFGIFLWSLATAMGAVAQNFWHLFLARGGTGAGESLKGPNALSMISDLVPREKLPSAMSLYTLGISAGAAFSMILGGALLGLFEGQTFHGPYGFTFTDWQMVFLLVGIPGVLVAALFFFTVKEPVRRRRANAKAKPPLGDVFRFIRANWKFYGFFLAGTAMLQIELTGMLIWRVSFYERTYGWTASTAGPLLGVLSLATTPIGLIMGAWIGEKMAKTGDPAAMMKLSIYAFALGLPFTIAYPLMPSPWLALGLAAISAIFLGASSPGTNSAMQIITPNEFRGQINALYLFTISVVGSAIAPLAVSIFTDFVFKDEAMLRYSMFSVALIFGTIGLLMKWLAMKPYTAKVAEIMAEEQALAAQ